MSRAPLPKYARAERASFSNSVVMYSSPRSCVSQGGSSRFPTWRPGQLPLQSFILPPLVPLVPLVQFPPRQSNCGRVKTSAGQAVFRNLLTVCRFIVLQRELIKPGHVITLVSTECDWTRWVIFCNPLLPGKHHYQGWNLSVTPLSDHLSTFRIASGRVNSCHIQFSHLILNYSMFAAPETI